MKLVLVCMALTACDTAPVTSDASADCQPFVLVPDATQFTCSPAASGPGCVGDPTCPFVPPYACDGGLRYPTGCGATLPMGSGSDFNCRYDNASENHCLCMPQPCTCNPAGDGGAAWYCPM